jgi:hypothetical protein
MSNVFYETSLKRKPLPPMSSRTFDEGVKENPKNFWRNIKNRLKLCMRKKTKKNAHNFLTILAQERLLGFLMREARNFTGKK